MPEGWQWDSSLFRGSAAFYGRGRLPYAPGFAGTLAGFLGWDGRGRLLDVGCGPGTVLLGLAHYFTEAVGVDPDGDMLAEARRQAGLRGVTNARWVTARAEELPAGLGEFRAVAFGNSFHWTDRARVAASVLAMLEPGGAFVHLSDLKDPSGESVPPGRPPEPSPPAPPYTDIAALKLRHLGPLRRAGRGTLPPDTPGREDLVLAAAGFHDFTRLVVPAGQVVERGADDIVAWVFSLSSSAPHLFGDRLQEFERDLRALLRRTSPDGRFAECLPATEIMTWRKPG
jgi:SAM-dependent methyltransferase